MLPHQMACGIRVPSGDGIEYRLVRAATFRLRRQTVGLRLPQHLFQQIDKIAHKLTDDSVVARFAYAAVKIKVRLQLSLHPIHIGLHRLQFRFNQADFFRRSTVRRRASRFSFNHLARIQ